MTFQSHTALYYTEWLVRILFGIGGVTATVAGSWLASKIRVYHDERKAHRDDLKKEVLSPLHDGLNEHFRPLVFNLKPVVFVAMGAPTQFAARRFHKRCDLVTFF